MHISFNPDEVQEALRNYVEKRGISTRGCTVEVNFVKTRGENGGMTAEVTVEPETPLTPADLSEGDAAQQQSLFPE